MKRIFVCILLLIGCSVAMFSQTLAEAKTLYQKGEYVKALLAFEAEYKAKPTDANVNHWYGACLFETNGDIALAEKCLLVSSGKNIQDSFLYLGMIYTEQFRFTEADEAYDKYESLLTKKGPRRKKEDLEKEKESLAELGEKKKMLSRLSRMVSNTEDIQIIDSIVVDKSSFLAAYKLSRSSGKLDSFSNVFKESQLVESVVYFNEKETKIYYSQPDGNKAYTLFSMEKLIDEYGNEKKLSTNNFGLTGDINYPFVMPDGVTIYFAAKDVESLGGYDLFISRYNLNNDTYLAPERLNMPFNSLFNDYMMVVDEEKGIGWFASDRYQPEGKVCIYTFIPNKSVKIVESDDEKYQADRARITSIKQTWQEGQSYSDLIALARKAAQEEVKEKKDFIFVVNDKNTYYSLSDFKNKAAHDTYFRVAQMKSDAESLSEKLDGLRSAYSASSQDVRRNMTSEILRLEKQLEQLRKNIPALEIQARNQENQNLK